MATTTDVPEYMKSYLSQMQANQGDLSTIGERVTAATQNMQVPDQSRAIREASKVAESIGGGGVTLGAMGAARAGPSTAEKATAGSIVSSFENQVEAAKKEAANRAAAMETRGEAVEGYIGNLRSMASTAVQGMGESLAAWNRYRETADEYVQASTARMAAVTQDIKNSIDKYAVTNDAALANSIQSASHTWRQTSKGTERAIAERYGQDSAEFRDYQSAKRASIGSIVSDLTAKAWDRTQSILNTGLGAVATAQTELAGHVNLAQFNSLNAHEAAAAAGTQLRLQTESFLMTMEAAVKTAWGEYAQWIDEASVPSVDLQPMFAQLMELDEQSRLRQQMEGEERDRASASAEANKGYQTGIAGGKIGAMFS